MLIRKPVATTTATKDSEAGEYVISVSGGEALNYELNYYTGTLTVTISSGINELMTNNPLNVYSLDGRLVKKGIATLKELNKGVYIMNGSKVVAK